PANRFPPVSQWSAVVLEPTPLEPRPAGLEPGQQCSLQEQLRCLVPEQPHSDPQAVPADCWPAPAGSDWQPYSLQAGYSSCCNRQAESCPPASGASIHGESECLSCRTPLLVGFSFAVGCEDARSRICSPQKGSRT